MTTRAASVGAHDHANDRVALSFTRAFTIGIALNTAFVAVEAFYGWRVNSLALLADAGHNLSDVAGLVLALGGTLAGKLKPDAKHTYGWKRASIVAALGNAVLLLVAMGALAWEALGRLRTPVATQGFTIMLVAGAGIAVNAGTAMLFMRGRMNDLNIRGAFVHMMADALVSAGVVVAGGLTLWFGWNRIDPVVSLVIAAVIVAGTLGLFRQSVHLLFDGVPDSIDLVAVRQFLESLPGVDRVAGLHVWAMGTSDIALTAHLVMPAGLANDAFFERATKELHDRFEITHVTLQPVGVAFTVPCSGTAPPSPISV